MKGDISRGLTRARREGRNSLLEPEAKELLRKFGIKTPSYQIARTRQEACAKAQKLGFPVVLKVVSSNILHKSDYGGVRLDLKNRQDVKRAYDQIVRATNSVRQGGVIQEFLVERMAPEGTEVIVGVMTNPQFGLVLVFGMGGIFVELYKDFSIRLIPVNRKDALEMIREVQAYELFKGFRGREPLDMDEVIRILLAVGGKQGFAMKYRRYVREIDLNPIIVYPKGAIVVDARVILQDSEQ